MIYQIFRRWHAGQRISEIKTQAGCDRKSIRYYVTELEARGFTREKQCPDKAALYTGIRDIIPKRTKLRNSFETLKLYEDELKGVNTQSSGRSAAEDRFRDHTGARRFVLEL